MLRSSFRTTVRGLALAAALLLTAPCAEAAEGTAVASEMQGFGRLVFTFDKALKADIRSSSGVIVIAFNESVTIDVAKLARQFPAYVSVVRQDPDGRTIRLATTRTLRHNMMEAGEKLFIDLLPDNWQGMPPGLPQDVVEQLARRAREAEEQVRKAQREREKREMRDVVARVGQGPTFTRLIFDIGQTVPVDIIREGDDLRLNFDAALRFNSAGLKAELPLTVQTITGESAGGTLKVLIRVESGTEMRAFREDDTVIVDFPRPRAKPDESAIIPPKADVASAPALPAAEAPKAAPVMARPAPPPLRALAETGRAVRPELARNGEGLGIVLPFAGPTPAAAFLREDVIWMVFDTREALEAVAVPENLRDLVSRLDVDRAAGAAILRLTLAKPLPFTFAEREGGRGWTASVSANDGKPLEPLLLTRGVSANGRTVLKAKLSKLGQIFWMDDVDTGDRLAVVTAMGPAHGMPKGQSFVELRAHPTVHGLALSPRSDDVTIEAGLDDVTVARDGGMTVSLGLPEGRADSGEGRRPLLLDVDTWRTARKGDVRSRANTLLRAAAEAPKKDLAEARLKLAAFQLASGAVTEAAGILKVVEQDDAVTASAKPVMLLRAISAVQSKDGREAARLLADNGIVLEPEAALWRAVLDANNGDWTPSLVGFRQSFEALDRYPDELQAQIRPLVVRAAVESGDATFAAQQLDQVERLLAREGDLGFVELMRGRIAALQNRAADAMSHYRLAAARSRSRETEAEARLEMALAQFADPKADHAAAAAELETVTMIWRRSEIEVRALAKLGELYGAEGRWRLAFSSARRASEVLPNHPMARKLHDRMAESFEELFLEGKADSLPKVEAVGLFYDFRHLMPISRRGDEIVRRLADRLAELDLLDQATELLQHQVDNRLGGLQRARVASRLAVLYLMNRKPAEAVQVLKKTRSNELPEDVRRGRLLLEARGLSELSRTDLALEILASQKGEDVDRLRADVLWRGKRWAESGEALERVLTDSWQGAEELSEARRADVMRSAVSFVLADDRIALDRLRQKFAPKMARGADARAFALVTSDHRSRPSEFRDIARTTVAEDTLSEFL
ncbi:MAG: hypothetical protein ACRC7C_18805, partial [Beijerinckiaceae bacterium]